MSESDGLRLSGRDIKTPALFIGGFVLLIWFLEVVDGLILGGALDGLGIVPRTMPGLRGVLFAPFLHDGLRHVAANTLPFIVLAALIAIRSLRELLLVTAIVALVSGLGTWLVGPSHSVHIGASGLVFGYFGYLVFRGYFERSWYSVLLALLVLFLYGGLIWGAIPQGNGISWQAHLFGFVGGALAARTLAERPARLLKIEIPPEQLSDQF